METEMEQIDKDDDQDNTNIPKKPSQSVAKLPPLILDRRFYMDTEYAPINNTLTCLRCGWCTNSVAEATKAFDICTHIKTEHKRKYANDIYKFQGWSKYVELKIQNTYLEFSKYATQCSKVF